MKGDVIRAVKGNASLVEVVANLDHTREWLDDDDKRNWIPTPHETNALLSGSRIPCGAQGNLVGGFGCGPDNWTRHRLWNYSGACTFIGTV
jgi:hypothetical protein